MALGSNCSGDNLLPISSAVLVAGAWGIWLGPSFRVALWLHCCPWGGAEVWVLSLAGKKLKEVALWGNSVAREPLFVILLLLEIRFLGHLIP